MQRICQYVLALRISKYRYCSSSLVTRPCSLANIIRFGNVRLLFYISICLGKRFIDTDIFYLFQKWCLRRVTLVICDSRGAYLRPYLMDDDIICVYYRGAGLRFVIRRLARLVGLYLPVTCLVMAGINDMTVMARCSRLVFPKYSDAFDLANYVINLLLSVRRDILACYPWLRIAFAGINGICLDRYNRYRSYPSDQVVINDAVLQINSYIRLLNQQSRLYHPRITSKVHAWRRGKRITRYKYLSDGLHPSSTLLSQWARAIRKFHKINTLGKCYVIVCVVPYMKWWYYSFYS